jgi:hypothetical protein
MLEAHREEDMILVWGSAKANNKIDLTWLF